MLQLSRIKLMQGRLFSFVSPTFLHSLLDLIGSELQHHDTQHPLFHGSWDWHSSVHGHWAAVWLAKQLGVTAIEDEIVQKIRSADFAAELQFLVDNPDFEMPYGRAWLLHLCLEVGDGFVNNKMQMVVDSLLRWVTSCKYTVQTGEYQNPCWVVIQLLSWYQNDSMERRILLAKGKELLDTSAPTFSQDAERAEFFSCWSLYLMLFNLVYGKAMLASFLHSFQHSDLRVVSKLSSIHHLGINPSRMWGLWVAYQVTREAKWKQAFVNHLEFCLDIHWENQQKRMEYRHWVPQFLVFALWLTQQDDLTTLSFPLRR